MGGTFYSSSNRSMRSDTMGFTTKSVNEIFTQQKERKVHESMNSHGMTIREARDSEAHPNSFPVILGLDVTGSMGHIPHDLIKEGLPTLMGTAIQKGATDTALCFIAIGDHEHDRHPLQVGQFESGDAELDMWLTRTYLEGGGGGNAGESYLLAWLFGARHTVTDQFEKRGKKGLLVTIGDEPNLTSIPASAVNEVTGIGEQGSLSSSELLAEVQKMYDVYHIALDHGHRISSISWKETLGNHCIVTTDYKAIPNIVADLIVKHAGYIPNKKAEEALVSPVDTSPSTDSNEILL